MEELLLRAVLVGEELDVVDQQRIERTVRRLEVVHLVVLQRFHHVADEALRVHIRDARIGLAREDGVADGVHQVRLAETDAAVDEERVVRAPWIFADLLRGGLGELVALADHEAVEGEVLVEPSADHETGGAAVAAAGQRGERVGSRAACSRTARRTVRAAGALGRRP